MAKQQRAIHLHVPKNDKMDIEFDNLSLMVPFGRGKKEILHGISGCFKSGELTAIMGPSGAGKSSLLNILSGFQKNGVSGIIRCTGQDEKLGKKITYKKDSCYILQDDRLCPLFTVGEVMNQAAKLKLGLSISEKAKELLILDILDTLGLANATDTKCGRLSGGQRKRLSVALELIDNPPIMFLDEPTTGLDSSASLQCISILKNLARNGRTIICTIHQPSATIFEMFDHVYVLAEGHCLYQGASSNTVPYLSSVGLDCPQYHNPADHLLEVANGEYGNVIDNLVKVCKDTNWRIMDAPTKIMEKKEEESIISDKTMVLIQAPSEFYRFCVLLQRCLVQLYRDWTVTHLKLVLHVLVGIVVGVLYMDYGNDGSKSIKNMGYFIVSIVYLSYTSMMPAIVRLPSEIPILKKESFNNWYKLRTYYLAFLISNIPVQMLFAAIYTSCSYFITGQPFELHRFAMFTTITILCTLTAEAIGVIIGTTANPVTVTHMKILFHSVIAVILGLLFFDYGNNGSVPKSNAGYLAVTITYLSYTALLPGVISLPSQISIIRKESFNNWYKLRTFYLASMISNFPTQVIFAFTYAFISYLLTGQPMELYRFLMFLIITILINLVGESVGVLLGTLVVPVTVTHMKILFHSVIAVILGLLFFDYGNNGSVPKSNAGYLAVTITYLSYTALLPGVISLPSQISIIRKESFNNWYKLRTFYLASMISNFPTQVIFAFTYAFISYLLTGQPMELYRSLMFLIITILINLVGESVGVLLGTLVVPVNGIFIGSVMTAVFLLQAGFFLLYKDMNKYFYFGSYFSYLAYSMDGLMQSLYGFNRTDLHCPDDVVYCVHLSPKSILEIFDMTENNYWFDVYYLVGFSLVAKIVAFFTLKSMASKSS